MSDHIESSEISKLQTVIGKTLRYAYWHSNADEDDIDETRITFLFTDNTSLTISSEVELAAVSWLKISRMP